MPKKHPSLISNPKEILKNLTKKSNKGSYHEVIHAAEILPELDPIKLQTDFSEFKKMIELLQK
jgi:hypothetical protein